MMAIKMIQNRMQEKGRKLAETNPKFSHNESEVIIRNEPYGTSKTNAAVIRIGFG